MADNYLEKQYADYEKRRAEWERQKKLGKIPKTKKSWERALNFFYTYILKFILKEGFLGVAQSEKPEFTKRKWGFRRQAQRENHPLK